jgi:hypothetical protein
MLAGPRLSLCAHLPLVLRLGIAVLSVCCTLVFVDQATAESCGHYVKRLGPGFVPGKAAAEQVAAQSHDVPPASPCGCKGPECQRAPLEHLPLAPATPGRITTPQDLTAVAVASLQLALDSGWLRGEISGRPSRGYPLETSRPPSA